MEIRNLKTIEVTGKKDDKFVGIKINDNQIEFHYPQTYNLSTDDVGLRKDILSILRTVSLAKTQTSDLSSYNSAHKEENVFPLGSFLWIINDYLTYGRYENREKEYIRGTKGKINWKKTMQTNPIISGKNIVYTEIVSEKKSQKDNLLTEIYNYCVKRAVDSIGWLYGITFDTNGIDYYKIFNQKLYINTINTEITHTFEDQKKTRLNNMKYIILGLDSDTIRTKEMIYGVDSYEYVYERMVDSMFSNIESINEFYPNALWNLRLESSPIKTSNLRPDTVAIKDNKVYILDSKYYRYGTTFDPNDMPDTTSIQKQITYGEYIKKVKEGVYDDVFSAFILPYSKVKNVYNSKLNQNMEFIGIATAEWTEYKDESNKQIVAVLLDTNFLVDNWTKKNKDNMNQLIEIIENNINKGGIL